MVYLMVQDGKYVKIGSSKNPKDRLDNFQKGNGSKLELWKVIPGEKREEFILHHEFKDFRIKDEWYEFSDEIKDSILKWEKLNDWPHIFKILNESQQPKVKRLSICGNAEVIDEIKEAAWRGKMSVSQYMIDLHKCMAGRKQAVRPETLEMKPHMLESVIGYSKDRQVVHSGPKSDTFSNKIGVRSKFSGGYSKDRQVGKK